MINMERAITYDWDKPLFKELGLKEFSFDKNQTVYVFIGETLYEGVKVRIFVSTMPAQFWKFDFISCGKKYVIETGSGSLTTYWNFIKQILDGMLEIKIYGKIE